MAQAIMNPEEVRRFAAELKRFNDDMQVKASSLQARFSALGSTWQDQEQEKFAEEFITTMKVLKKFLEISEKQAPHLLRKAQRIEEYLSQQ
ncbi:MAG: WXG100 family type VII secretion target [Chthoniobacterales bacterium]